MPIRFRCAYCNQLLGIARRKAGTVVRCPGCSGQVVVPSLEEAGLADKTAPPSQIEAIDMGRRAIHNDGSHILMERLKDKVKVDLDTARRLFTLICVLHWKG